MFNFEFNNKTLNLNNEKYIYLIKLNNLFLLFLIKPYIILELSKC